MKKKLFFILFGTTVLMLFFMMVYLPGYSHYQEINRREELLEKNIEEYRKSNEQMEKELALLRSDVTYLEKVIRDKMGLVKPGEVLYKFVEEEAVVDK
jgi:cell division protein FtsB